MKVLFAGPSLHRDLPSIRMECPTISCMGPARCGDIASAVQQGAGAIALVDGLFAESAAPWHKEILFAIGKGVRIAGAASMGALRAAECRAFGMIGIGAIFERYATTTLTDDSDVAQLHAPRELDYLPLTEPWINIEPTFQKLEAEMALPASSMSELRRIARQLHYSERTYAEIVRQCRHMSAEQQRSALAWLQENAIDQKRLDALACVDWLRAQSKAEQPSRPTWDFAVTTHFLQLLASVRDRAVAASPD
jgi:hypothetical protein